MRALDRKLFRDLVRLWPQSLAVALVMACGVATLLMAIGASRSLDETRSAYYERYRFGDVFASATRAPMSVAAVIAGIDGVAAVDARVSVRAVLDLDDMAEPGSAVINSLPPGNQPAVNALFLREGRFPEPGTNEAVVSDNFAKAHRFTLGSTFRAIIDGAKTRLTIVGTVLSPEYVYALGPGDMMPDDRRFGTVWMAESTLAPLAGLEGAFNSLGLRLIPGAAASVIVEKIDDLLNAYGGDGAYLRKDQLSNAFLDGELTQLRGMAFIIPPIFLLVSAFLINMILSRLIALEREQIGLLKALGYSRVQVLWHYLKLVLVVTAVGILIGIVAGNWLGTGMTRMYSEFYSFPFLIFRRDPDTYLIAAGVTLAAAIVGAARAMGAAFALPAAVAMRPPTPPVYRRMLGGMLARFNPFSQLTTMAIRDMGRHPVRTGISILGTSFAVGLFTIAMGSMDSVVFMMDAIFFRTDRQDATLMFSSARPPSALAAVGHLPGVLRAEPNLWVPVRVTNGQYSRQLTISGRSADADLSRILDLDLKPIVLPESGLVIGDRVASTLHVRPGDLVEVEIMVGQRLSAAIPVTQIIQSYIGMMLFMPIDELSRLAWGGPRISSVNLQIDPAEIGAFYRAVKETPQVGSLALQANSRQRFAETMQTNMNTMLVVYLVLSVVISFGVVYNSARIQLSERARELATLRVLGFGRREVSNVLLIELATIVALAQPAGWAFGYLLGLIVTSSLSSDLFRVPFIIEPDTFAAASLVVAAAAVVSALVVRRRIDRFDLVQVLKTRE
ncbi:MAG TPA: ABC transporter permease [Bauldia sp.]|nr:ABC transporter permease [Bauldia sp.]